METQRDKGPFRDQETLTVSFPPREAKVVRIVFENERDAQMEEIEVLAEGRVHLWEIKSGFARRREHGGNGSKSVGLNLEPASPSRVKKTKN